MTPIAKDNKNKPAADLSSLFPITAMIGEQRNDKISYVQVTSLRRPYGDNIVEYMSSGPSSGISYQSLGKGNIRDVFAHLAEAREKGEVADLTKETLIARGLYERKR